MAEQKDDPSQTAKLAQSRKTAATSGPTDQAAAQERSVSDRVAGDDRSGASAGAADKTPATVVRRKQRYLIGFRAFAGIAAQPSDPFLETDPFLERLAQMEGVEIIRRLRARGAPVPVGSQMAPASSLQEILVARMDEQRGEALRRNAPPHIVVERDAALSYSHMAAPDLMSWPLAARAMPFPRSRREIRVRVLGEGDRPLASAVVTLYGSGFPAQAITDSSGQANLQSDVIDGGAAVAIYVRPAADHWERYISNPSLDPGQVNVIRLDPLDRHAGGFPGERRYGWGQRLMKLDRVTEWNGAGAKVGLIDSGCDSAHPLLRHIVRGLSLIRDNDAQSNDAQSWKSDELGHGTHCAGIVAAAAAPAAGAGIVGCAPAAEVHVFKVVPGGYFSDLIDALDQCIERRLDVVHIGVSGEDFSELVAQKITEARLYGVACVAGSGNTGAAVQFPGNVPGVLTVSAVGKLGEYPQDTRHAQRALPQLIGISGVYATNFSCWGPPVGVCAPGVAVISSVPGGGFAAWDGSSMAAAHVVGFSALLLAHHPMLQSINYGARADQRISVLFDFLRAAAVPYAQVDPNRVGAGLPDMQQVPGISPSNQAGPAFHPAAVGMLQPPMAPPAAHLAHSMNAILQLRAAGLWL
jgi:subtilisin